MEQKKRLLEESHDSLSEELAKLQDQGNAQERNHTLKMSDCSSAANAFSSLLFR